MGLLKFNLPVVCYSCTLWPCSFKRDQTRQMLDMVIEGQDHFGKSYFSEFNYLSRSRTWVSAADHQWHSDRSYGDHCGSSSDLQNLHHDSIWSGQRGHGNSHGIGCSERGRRGSRWVVFSLESSSTVSCNKIGVNYGIGKHTWNLDKNKSWERLPAMTWDLSILKNLSMLSHGARIWDAGNNYL